MMLEVRTYTLRPGTRSEFHRLMAEISLADRQQSQDRFYGSDEWKLGPREPILALIDTYTSVVLELDEAVVGGLRD